ncbi:RNA ligase partner protein [Candidatus Woesebacteria bacterium]|nr:RNA ligase partner protein [Candidatus Woesebacteria bacterium]
MKKIVIDTNVLFNMSAGINLGSTTKEVVGLISQSVSGAQGKEKIALFTTPGVVKEIESFFENNDKALLQDFLQCVTIKSPSIFQTSIPASIMKEYINESRARAYRGLTIAEEEIINVGRLFMGKEALPEKEFQMTVGKVIKNVRERYRNATRTGFIDSTTDFELIILSRVIEGYLVSTDEGVMKWARKFGVLEMSPEVFGKEIRACA